MDTVNIHEAKTHLSRLVEKASSGEAFIIAKTAFMRSNSNKEMNHSLAQLEFGK